MSKEMNLKIALVTIDLKSCLSAFKTNTTFIKSIEPLSSQITWISTNCFGDNSKLSKKIIWTNLGLLGKNEGTFLKRITSFLAHQKNLIIELKKLKEIDVIFYLLSGDLAFLIPFLFAVTFLKLKKKSVLRVEGRSSTYFKSQSARGKNRITRILKIIVHSIIESIVYSLAHRIIILCEYQLEKFDMQKYQNKISAVNYYVDFTLYKKVKELKNRNYQIGYCGRLSEEKGALEFAQALPLILKDENSKAIIVGDGQLRDEIKNIITINNIQNKVDLTLWVASEKIPEYLNDMQIVILPSYIEGFPQTIMEAMACGTLVLATPVGGIPGLIEDNKTGFIMENNTPECIAQNVIRVLNHPNIDAIINNASSLVERELSYQAIVDKHRKVLSSMDL